MRHTYQPVSVVSMYDDSGYDRDDPKHPDFLESLLTWADNKRKAVRENADTADEASDEDAAA